MIGGTQAVLTRKGDGVCYVRCSPKNGHDHAAFLSMLRVEITGLGKANFDPYAFVAGGLYNACNQPLDSGNEHGVATRKAGESHVGFRNLDFGPDGADRVKLCWRSELPKNAVQIIIADDRETKRILIEIDQALDY